MSYLVIDTEGNPNLKEIALIDSSGQLIYHAYTQEYSPHHPRPKPLTQIVADLQRLTQGKTLVFHHADHDLKILKQAFDQVNQDWLPNPIFCTWSAAKQCFPNLAGYGLEYLSKHLGIQLESGYFNSKLAHDASYDALFTYHLYRHLTHAQLKAQNVPNPFANSRVDNPFQHYPDETTIYQPQYQQLTATLQDIQRDPNHQSRGVVLLGEPGSGKTHLIMRVAQNLLRHNRLLFIPQPTHPDNIYHHIYSHTLESLRERVDAHHHTQLDYLIAKSFVEILKTFPQTSKTEELLSLLTADPLNLFHRLGAEGTERRRQQWQAIEKLVLRWWAEQNFLTGSTENILKGIIKYCSYRDPNRRHQIIRWLSGTDLDPEETNLIGLPPWSADPDRNTFALEGMKVIGRLSLLDQPLIIVFDQLEALGREENRDILLNFGDALKELFTRIPNSLFVLNLFPDRWQHFQTQFDRATVDRLSQTVLSLDLPSLPQLQALLQSRLPSGIHLQALFTADDLSDILSQPSIRAILNRASAYYRHYINGIPLPPQVQVVPTASNLAARVQRLETELQTLKQLLIPLLPAHGPSIVLSPPLRDPSPSADLVETLDPYLRTTEAQLRAAYPQEAIIDSTADIGKLRTIGNALQGIRPVPMSTLKLGKRKLPDHLYFSAQKRVIAFIQVGPSSMYGQLNNFNQLVIAHPELQFLLLRDARLKPPSKTATATKAALAALNNSPNGKYALLTQDDRIHLELMHRMITDIQNRDLEIDLTQAVRYYLDHRDPPLIAWILGRD
ncbi:AAA family ATPase [Synechococcus sp. R60.3]|uniref:AAA family ATPase n=1 Tax=unclassified Synechococcus TaxID=2626047 RepID=UPI0039C00643